MVSESVKVEWDYTEHAQHYDKRADYSELAISKLIAMTECQRDKLTADIGAGTGKLTKELLKLGLEVISVEPNAAMREFGIKNTLGQKVEWRVGTGEETGIKDKSVQAAFFGSSFNVVDQQKALVEVKRILEPNGWFACMWNHRDLDEKIQKDIEVIIKKKIHNYSYGSRREDPTEAINTSGLFGGVRKIEERFITEMTRDEILIAWKSHATLRREAGSDAIFDSIISDIEHYLSLIPEPVLVPYFTRIYTAQLK
ncbi:class I SAM-dependent methyltransferase [Aeromonas jandaei]|uniref:class I SAM-dependent methyltransferase n=1 Tax=Aeromonas jandaei TaxID=650 RepID=UPI001C5BF882|nr:class I SAM-dependent methyltransferase [Aeromonas jandaei]MBW3762546.1 class I SAM-dependent methyltransferase [Aeromonas jandaei]